MSFQLNPKYVTFDCYGTLIDFPINKVTIETLGDRLDPEKKSAFLADFSAIRVDEVLGPWKPYPNVMRDSLARAMSRYDLPYRPSDGDAIVDAIPTWVPHPEVPAALARVADAYPLVILSNADPGQIKHNVESMGVEFYKVLTSTAAHAYKPRHAAFEYMLDTLGCTPGELLHVSSSMRYDMQPAKEMRIEEKLWVNRSGKAPYPGITHHEANDLNGLPELLGL